MDGGQNSDPQSTDLLPWTTHIDYPKMDCAIDF